MIAISFGCLLWTRFSVYIHKPVFPIPSIYYVAVKCKLLSQMIGKSPSPPMLFGGSSGLACILPAPNTQLVPLLVLLAQQQLSHHAQWSLDGSVRKSKMKKKRKLSATFIVASKVHRPYSHMHFLLLVLAEPLTWGPLLLNGPVFLMPSLRGTWIL